MDTEEIILVVVILGIPAFLFPVVIAYLRTENFQRRFPNALYQFTLLGHSLVLSKHFLLQGTALLFLYSWLDMFMPLPFTLLFVVMALLSLKIADAKTIDEDTIAESSKELLERLSRMQREIGDIREHIEGLGYHIEIKQIELDEKEKRRKALEKDIEEKSTEASQWKNLTEEQRKLVLDSAVDAMSKESKGTFWLGLLFGFFVNILATLTWTLLGNPGKQQILDNAKGITGWLN